MNVVVVGAGLGGLSAACHLAGRGHDVTVLERATVAGGRAGLLELSGYRFDTGPTVLTMPDLLADVFAAAGESMEDHLELRRLDPAYRATFSDGSELSVRAGREAMTEEIRSVCGPADAAAFGPFCDWLTDLYELEMPNFIDTDFDSPLELIRRPMALARLVATGGLRKLGRVVEERFGDDRLRRILTFQSMYAGLSPFEALAIYGVITYMDTVAGVFTAVGGMHAIPVALAEAATKAGAEVRYGSTVETLTRSPGGAVDGVVLADGSRLRADAVVVNTDVPVAYRTLLGEKPPLVNRIGRYSPSCVVWLVGARGELPVGTEHHNIHFGDQWEGAFDALISKGVRMPDRSLLVSVPTLSDPTLAPSDRHILYVLEPAPNLAGKVDWHRERDRVRRDLGDDLASRGYPTDIEVEHLTDPLDWAAQGMERGTPFALAHKFFQTGPFRPHTADPRYPGLVLVGSGTQPGVGIPMVLLSGRFAADRVDALAVARGSGSARGPRSSWYR